MPSALVATVGGANSNSYLTLSEFAALADDGPSHAVYTAATDDDRTRALLQATQRLGLEKWQGVRVTTSQALAWPRSYVVDPDKTGNIDGSTMARPTDLVVYYPITTIPDRIRSATAELALVILGTTGDLFARDETRDYVRAKVDVIEVEYKDAPRLSTDSLANFPRVQRAIAPLLDTYAGSAVVRG